MNSRLGGKMKAFNAIVLLLILIMLGFSTYLTWQMKKDEVVQKPPIEAFEKAIKKYNPNPMEILGWEQNGNGVVVYTDLKAPSADSFYQYSYYFMLLETPKGQKWFLQNEGALEEVEVK